MDGKGNDHEISSHFRWHQERRASTTRWSTCWANRLPSPAPSAFPPRYTRIPGGPSQAYRFISGQARTPCANWVGSRWECWSSPRCPASKRALGPHASRRLTLCWSDGGDPLYLCYWMRQSGLADLLPSLRRDGLCGSERREHGDDPRHRGGLRPLESAHRRRQSAGHG